MCIRERWNVAWAREGDVVQLYRTLFDSMLRKRLKTGKTAAFFFVKHIFMLVTASFVSVFLTGGSMTSLRTSHQKDRLRQSRDRPSGGQHENDLLSHKHIVSA